MSDCEYSEVILTTVNDIAAKYEQLIENSFNQNSNLLNSILISED